MNRINLIGPDFLNPVWIRKISNQSFFRADVLDNCVTVEGVTLRLSEALPDKTPVRCYFPASFYCVTEADAAEAEAERLELKRQADEKRKNLLNLRRREAEEFNAAIYLPVQWSIGQKEVLSGLSATSNGDGMKRNTVNHVLLLGDLKDRRLMRKAHDFLCTSQSGSNGNSWSDGNYNITCTDGDGNKYQPKPTCKQCLKLLERFRAFSHETNENA